VGDGCKPAEPEEASSVAEGIAWLGGNPGQGDRVLKHRLAAVLEAAEVHGVVGAWVACTLVAAVLEVLDSLDMCLGSSVAATLAGCLQAVGVPVAAHLALSLGAVAGTLWPSAFEVGVVPSMHSRSDVLLAPAAVAGGHA